MGDVFLYNANAQTLRKSLNCLSYICL